MVENKKNVFSLAQNRHDSSSSSSSTRGKSVRVIVPLESALLVGRCVGALRSEIHHQPRRDTTPINATKFHRCKYCPQRDHSVDRLGEVTLSTRRRELSNSLRLSPIRHDLRVTLLGNDLAQSCALASGRTAQGVRLPDPLHPCTPAGCRRVEERFNVKNTHTHTHTPKIQCFPKKQLRNLEASFFPDH